MSTTFKVIIAIVVTAAVVGGGLYWYMQDQTGKLRDENTKQVEELNSQIKELKSAQVTQSEVSATVTPTAKVDPYAYANSKYGFSLTFNSKWEGYELVEKASDDSTALAYLYACVPTADKTWKDEKAGMFCPFAITVVKASGRTAFEQANEPRVPSYITSSSSYAFYYETGQATPTDGSDVYQDTKTIATSFKVN